MNRVTEKLCAPADDYSSAPRAINGTIHSSTTIEQIVVLVAVMLARALPGPTAALADPIRSVPSHCLLFISLVAPIVARAHKRTLLPGAATHLFRHGLHTFADGARFWHSDGALFLCITFF
jgi:hypothetical protein